MSMFYASCQNYGAAPPGGLPLDAISYWPLESDAGGGTVADLGPQATILNMYLGGVFVDGINGGTNAWQGDGAAYLSSESTAKAVTYLTDHHTISLWIQMPAATGYYYLYSNHVRGAGAGSALNNGTFIDINGGNVRAGFMVQNSESFTDSNGNTNTSYSISAKSNVTVTPNQWHHVAAVFNKVARSASLYIDGVLNVTVSATQQPSFNATTRGVNSVGCLRYNSPNQTFYQLNGNIDQVRHYDRALSLAEITALAGEKI